ncbi:MAG: hypothetical protein AAGE59_12935 [Cyanobacteria bacterium P01_F01_bin.86]
MTKASLHRFARLPQRFLVSLGLGLGLLTVGAIAPPPSPTQDNGLPAPQPVRTDYGALAVAVNETETLWQIIDETVEPASPTIDAVDPANILTVTVYTPTATCEGFESQQRAIAADQAVPQLVQLLLADQVNNLVEFDLSGYRIQTEQTGNSITVDFRRAPGADRHFISLSICEQLVLFGSLRKTLLENPALDIDVVRFTEKGRLIEI